jgi:hypothetical protein
MVIVDVVLLPFFYESISRFLTDFKNDRGRLDSLYPVKFILGHIHVFVFLLIFLSFCLHISLCILDLSIVLKKSLDVISHGRLGKLSPGFAN